MFLNKKYFIKENNESNNFLSLNSNLNSNSSGGKKFSIANQKRNNYFDDEQLKNEIKHYRQSCLGFIDSFGVYYLNLNANYVENLSDLLNLSIFQRIQYNSKISVFYQDQKNAMSSYE